MIRFALLALVALLSACAGQVESEPEPGDWHTYVQPGLTCLLASAPVGGTVALANETLPEGIEPLGQVHSTVSYNTRKGESLRVALWCSEPGACEVRITTPDDDPDCAASFGAAVGVAGVAL